MQSLYSNELRVYLRSLPWPKGFVYEIVEYPEYLGFRAFRDNFNSFDGETRWQIAMLIKEAMEKIRKDGIPIYMEKMESVYGQRNNLAY